MASSESDRVPLVLITSHAHNPPLCPAPDLKYDLRTTPNPPKAIRDNHTGLSKKLREHLLAQDVFVSLLERAEREIKTAMGTRIRNLGPKDTEAAAQGADHTIGETDNQGDSPGADHEEDEHSDGVVSCRPTLRVGVFCARGQHRSVAFVEELSRRSWPKEWEVRIEHRDVGKARNRVGKGREKFKRGVKGGTFFLGDGET
jgi:hypothetical protein